MRLVLVAALGSAVVLLAPVTGGSQQARTSNQRMPAADLAPPLTSLVSQPTSELSTVVARYSADRATLLRRYDVEFGSERRARLRDFIRAWPARLREVNHDRLGPEGRIDFLLLSKHLANGEPPPARDTSRHHAANSTAPFDSASARRSHADNTGMARRASASSLAATATSRSSSNRSASSIRVS